MYPCVVLRNPEKSSIFENPIREAPREFALAGDFPPAGGSSLLNRPRQEKTQIAVFSDFAILARSFLCLIFVTFLWWLRLIGLSKDLMQRCDFRDAVNAEQFEMLAAL